MSQYDWLQYDDDVLQAQIRFLEGEARRGVLPECAVGGECYDCPLISDRICELALDADFMSLLSYYNSIYMAAKQLQQRRVNAVAKVLQRHRLAMHWELVAKILKEEEPGLFSTDRAVLNILARNPHRFSQDTVGSYFLGSA